MQYKELKVGDWFKFKNIIGVNNDSVFIKASDNSSYCIYPPSAIKHIVEAPCEVEFIMEINFNSTMERYNVDYALTPADDEIPRGSIVSDDRMIMLKLYDGEYLCICDDFEESYCGTIIHSYFEEDNMHGSIFYMQSLAKKEKEYI